MPIRLSAVALLIAIFAIAPHARAHDYRQGDIVIDHPWARASAGNARTGAAYLALANDGAAPDRLLAAATPVAERAEVHTHMDEDGVMKMRPVEALELAPGEEVTLAPGGLHIMLMGLTAPLVDGDSFPLTLTFERAGEIVVTVEIGGVGAMPEAPAQDADHDAGHGHGEAGGN